MGAVLVIALLAGCAGGSEGEARAPGSPNAGPATATAVPSESTTARSTAGTTASSGTDASHPDILDVDLEPAADGTWDVRVTVSSPYDTPERYADGWRVLAPDGTVLGMHTLAHDHASEQPFTRTMRGLVIPDGVGEVAVEGRDLANGYGGTTVTVEVP